MVRGEEAVQLASVEPVLAGRLDVHVGLLHLLGLLGLDLGVLFALDRDDLVVPVADKLLGLLGRREMGPKKKKRKNQIEKESDRR